MTSKLDDLIAKHFDGWLAYNKKTKSMDYPVNMKEDAVGLASDLVEALKEEINDGTCFEIKEITEWAIGEIDLAFKRIKGEKE
jgi:hypothetical protein